MATGVGSGDHKSTARRGKGVPEYPKHGPTSPADIVPRDVLEDSGQARQSVRDHTETTHHDGLNHDGVDFVARMRRRSVSDAEMDAVMGVGESFPMGMGSEERSKPGHTKGVGKTTPNLDHGS